jgi:hypothetical protein
MLIMKVTSELSRRESNELIQLQVNRAASIVKKPRYYDMNNGESVTFDTPWVNLAYDVSSDTVRQARLHGVFGARLKLFAGNLSCVHLYTRDAGLYDPRKQQFGDDYTYTALFSGHNQEITIPKDGVRFPFEGEQVLPNTSKWRELDYVLGQIESQE